MIPGAFRIDSLQDEMTGVSLAGTQLRVNEYAMHDHEWNDIKVSTTDIVNHPVYPLLHKDFVISSYVIINSFTDLPVKEGERSISIDPHFWINESQLTLHIHYFS